MSRRRAFLGLLSCFFSRKALLAEASRYEEPIVLLVGGLKHNLGGKVWDFGTIPDIVREYGTPALAVRADDVTVKNFTWRGSMEGVHVGSQPFTPVGMRQRHQPIRVTLDGLRCDDVGEDAISIQPRARVLLKNSQLQGNHGRMSVKTKEDGHFRGMDKLVQIDGAEVTIENCTFRNGMSAIRGKAGSVIRVRHCKFIECATCVTGDGLDNPRPKNTYDGGRKQLCRIIVEDCEAWDCGTFARAAKNCHIELYRLTLHGTHLRNEDGGKVTLMEI